MVDVIYFFMTQSGNFLIRPRDPHYQTFLWDKCASQANHHAIPQWHVLDSSRTRYWWCSEVGITFCLHLPPWKPSGCRVDLKTIINGRELKKCFDVMPEVDARSYKQPYWA